MKSFRTHKLVVDRVGVDAGGVPAAHGVRGDGGDVQHPPVHGDDVGLGDVEQDFPERLVPELAAPVERSGEVVAGAQGYDPDGRPTPGKTHRVHHR